MNLILERLGDMLIVLTYTVRIEFQVDPCPSQNWVGSG
jgi:hypothetical protein